MGAAAGRDERLEEAAVRAPMGEELGVPLHGEQERVGGSLVALHRAVGGPRGGAEPVAEAVDGLVVEGVDAQLLGLQRGGQAAAGQEGDGVGRLVGRIGLAVVDEGAGAAIEGRCWCSVPPSATFRSWDPRQIARIGRPRVNAARASASSVASSSASVGPRSGSGSAP